VLKEQNKGLIAGRGRIISIDELQQRHKTSQPKLCSLTKEVRRSDMRTKALMNIEEDSEVGSMDLLAEGKKCLKQNKAGTS